MPLRAPKKPRKTKTVRASSLPRKLSVTLFVLTASVIIAFTALISFEASLLATGFITVFIALFYEERRRKLWEKAFGFKAKHNEERYDRLTRDITRNSLEIDRLKAAYSTPPEALESVPQNSQGRPKEVPEKAPMKAPRKTPSARPIYANDDPYFEENALSDMVITELVHHAVRSSRIDLFLQPVMALPQRKTRYYEVFARIRARAGSYLPAHQYMKFAQKESLTHHIDTLLLIECLKTINATASLKRATPFILNISSDTLGDKGFMNKLLSFLAKNRALAPRLIFEIKQRDFEDMSPAVLEVLRGLGTLGCALSIDNVEHLQFDIKFLQVLKVRLIKFPAKRLLQDMKTPQGLQKISRLKRALEGNGIAFVVERIETEGMMRGFLDLDIQNGQGYLFGKPELQGAYERQNVA